MALSLVAYRRRHDGHGTRQFNFFEAAFWLFPAHCGFPGTKFGYRSNPGVLPAADLQLKELAYHTAFNLQLCPPLQLQLQKCSFGLNRTFAAGIPPATSRVARLVLANNTLRLSLIGGGKGAIRFTSDQAIYDTRHTQLFRKMLRLKILSLLYHSTW